jgi:hypothetical protein
MEEIFLMEFKGKDYKENEVVYADINDCTITYDGVLNLKPIVFYNIKNLRITQGNINIESKNKICTVKLCKDSFVYQKSNYYYANKLIVSNIVEIDDNFYFDVYLKEKLFFSDNEILDILKEKIKNLSVFLCYISQAFKTREICLLALFYNAHYYIKYVPTELLDQNFYSEVCKISNHSILLREIPEKYINEELILELNKKEYKDPRFINYIPSSYKTKEILYQVIKKGNGLLKDVIEIKEKNKDIVEIKEKNIIEEKDKNKNKNIIEEKDKNKNKNIIEEKDKNKNKNIIEEKDKNISFLDENFYLSSLAYNMEENIKYVPKEYLTENFILKCDFYDYRILKYLPNDLKPEDLLLKIYKENKKSEIYMDIQFRKKYINKT